MKWTFFFYCLTALGYHGVWRSDSEDCGIDKIREGHSLQRTEYQLTTRSISSDLSCIGWQSSETANTTRLAYWMNPNGIQYSDLK